jgi:hypothetical protein
VSGYARALTAVLAAFVALLGGLVTLVYLSREEGTLAVDNLLAEDLTRAISVSRRVDVAAIADFPWTRLLIADVDTPHEDIARVLGGDYPGELDYDAGSTKLFLFAGGTKLLRFADYRGSARFEGFDEPVAELPRDAARFVVRAQVVRPG